LGDVDESERADGVSYSYAGKHCYYPWRNGNLVQYQQYVPSRFCSPQYLASFDIFKILASECFTSCVTFKAPPYLNISQALANSKAFLPNISRLATTSQSRTKYRTKLTLISR